MPPLKVGLALGGGGAKGIAHIGVLKVFEKEGIEIDTISGTSFGSIIGAMYAQSPDIDRLRKRVLRFLKSDQFRRTKIFFIKRHYEEKKNKGFITSLKTYLQKGIFWGISLQGTSFISEQTFLGQIALLLDDKAIEDTEISFVALASDLSNGGEKAITKGPIRQAVAASCAIPGVFPPIEIGGCQLIDGGWVNQVPVMPLKRLGADFTIAVSIAEDCDSTQSFASGLDVVLRANEITRCILSASQMEEADFVIRPELGDIHWSDFWRYHKAIELGEAAAQAAVKPLKKMLWKRRVREFLNIPYAEKGKAKKKSN